MPSQYSQLDAVDSYGKTTICETRAHQHLILEMLRIQSHISLQQMRSMNNQGYLR